MKKALKTAAIDFFNLVFPDPEGTEPTTWQLVVFYAGLVIAAAGIVAWNCWNWE